MRKSIINLKEQPEYWLTLEEVKNMIKLTDWGCTTINISKEKPISTADFLFCFLDGYKNSDEVGKQFGISGATISNRLKQIPRFLETRGQPGSKQTVWIRTLLFLGLKRCFKCQKILPLEFFRDGRSDKNRADGKTSECAVCGKKRYESLPAEVHEKYKKEVLKPGTPQHAKKLARTRAWKARTNYDFKNRLSDKQRRPDWAEVEKIEKIYRECPDGMHVDHIIPKRGKLVSGLDVHYNLQYLDAVENMKKNNNFDPDNIPESPFKNL